MKQMILLAAAAALIGGMAMAQDSTTGPQPVAQPAGEITSGEWQLLAVNGARPVSESTFSLDTEGRVTGRAACNRYFGITETVLPAVKFGAIGSTRMACERMDEESAYLSALPKVDKAELREGHLILTGAGTTLEFVRDRGDKGLDCLTCG